MPTLFAPAIRTRENLRHFSFSLRNLSELADGAIESHAVGLVPQLTTQSVHQTPMTLREDRRGDDHVPT